MKTLRHLFVGFLVAAVIAMPLFSLREADASSLSTEWFNGTYKNSEVWDYSTNYSQPNYGTHDWIADHAMHLLPESERGWIENNYDAFLLGTEAPDNAELSYLGKNTGYGDFQNHVIAFDTDGIITNDAAARRAKEEYNKADQNLPWNERLAAYYAGAMTHYIADVSAYPHVMGGDSFLPGASNHSEYERGVEAYTTRYNGGKFESFIPNVDELGTTTAYNAAIQVARTTTFGYGSTWGADWMNNHMPLQGNSWNTSANATFTGSAADSLGRAVIATAKVLHTLALRNGYVLERVPESSASRYETAVGISQKMYPEAGSASSVFLVSGRSYLDAVPLGSLASQENGVILFADTSSVPAVTLNEIARVLPHSATSKIYVVGKSSVITTSVDDYLNAHFVDEVVRITPWSRVDESVQVAGLLDVTNTAFLVQSSMVDGIPAGAVSAREGWPILVTPGSSLASDVADFLQSEPKGESISHIYIVGGTSAISSSVESALTLMGKTVTRISGTDRFDTSKEVALEFFEHPASLALANGYSLVDAVSGSVLGGSYNAPVLLTQASSLPVSVSGYVHGNAGTLTSGFVFGGTTAISYPLERVLGLSF